jgi:hypothetical protein
VKTVPRTFWDILLHNNYLIIVIKPTKFVKFSFCMKGQTKNGEIESNEMNSDEC